MSGLTQREAEIREVQGLANEQVNSSTRTVKEIVKSNIFTYFNLIFTVLALLLILVGSFKDLTFMLIVLANTAIGIAQEIRSKKTLDKLKFLKMPKANVIRDGKEVQVPVESLVLDDWVIFKAGNQIPADAVVVSGSIQVNEALITGEADEITKGTDDGLLSGSFVVSGECVAVLTAVGRESYISKLTIEATKDKGVDQSEMIRALDRLVKIIGIIIIPVGIVLFVQQCFILEDGFSDSVTSMVAAVIGMIPEGLYLMASIAMVVSAMRLAKKDVLVQNMKSIETLARVDVLCVDKTGTITENEMRVATMEPVYEGISEDALNDLIGDLAQSMNKDNITMAAMQEYFQKNSGREATSVCGFSSKYKYCGASFGNENFLLGAPEFVLRDGYNQFSEYITEVSSKGYRVLAFARSDNKPDGKEIKGNVQVLAFVLLENPIRAAARETFEYFANNDVEVKVISGDNPVTVSNIAMQAGIPRAESYVDATNLHNPRAIYEAAERYTVFGRVTPDQKRMLVKALQKQGRTVGMTGDGVNDILALRDADCSIAMASGSEAASNAAQMVLLDSDFSKMPSVVDEGRRVVNNIEKTATLFLTKNIFSLLLAAFSMISVLSYPLKPSQITLISMFTIGMPAFVLSLEPNHNIIKGKFFGNVFKMAAPAGITTFISVSSLVVFGLVFEIQKDFISTSSTVLVGLVGFMILAKVAKPANKLHVGLITSMVLGMAYCIFFVKDLFGIDSLSGQSAMLLVVFLMATEAMFRYIYKFTSFCGNILGNIGKRKGKRREN